MGRLQGTDPDGSGINEQKVNKEGQALTAAVGQLEIEHESEENGTAYNWTSGKVAIDAADTVLLVKNTSDTTLHIECVVIDNGVTDSEFQVHLPTADVTVASDSGGGTVTGTNINTTSSNVADASAASDENGNSQGNIIANPFMSGDRTVRIGTPGLILGKNKSLAIDSVAAQTEVSVTILGHYAD